MATAAVIAAWEAEGLRLLRTAAKDEDRAALRRSAERLSVAARAPRSRPAFERVAALTCEFLAAKALCAVSACSQSLARVAREDRFWQALTARRFPEARDLRSAASRSSAGGFEEFTRMTRIWKVPETFFGLSDSRRFKPDVYSMLVVFKVNGERVAGGCFPQKEKSDYGFIIDVEGILAPPFLAGRGIRLAALADARSGFTVSLCVVRNSDGKCLQLLTDVDAEQQTEFMCRFEGNALEQISEFPSAHEPTEAELDDLQASHGLEISTPVLNEQDELIGFEDTKVTLTLFDFIQPYGPAKVGHILQCWATSANWI
mmetsp:Transcript_11892/g.35451  ORF Transcript_11892/g.35451 Transcript_11892/m.35451 type:complete len:316 (-) Transcript_11892:34-981(-)